MPDYRTLDLSSLCNTTTTALVPNEEIPSGERQYHGLPFLLGGAGGRVIGLGEGLGLGSVVVAVGQALRHVVFAHRLIDSKLQEGDPVGRTCAEYVFGFADGEAVSVPVRERLEIGKIPIEWGQIAMLCYPDEKDSLQPRYSGNWEAVGRRQTEANQSWPKAFYLWAWTNPTPERKLESITLVPKGPRFFVAAITLGQLGEFPFNRNAKLDVKLTLDKLAGDKEPFDLSVEVDRGVATYPYPLPQQSAEEFLSDGHAGWGQSKNDDATPAYVQIAANPSATVSVKQGSELVGSARWGDVLEKGKVDAGPRLHIELVDHGRNWVHTTVLDDDSGKPVPCRVHFRSAEGIPYQPHGYHDHVGSDLGTWHLDNGGDLRLGQISYAYIRGECQGWLPRGDVIVDIARGFEYEPLRTRVELQPGQRELTFRLKRFRNMNAERYFSGDTHVHFLSTQGAHLEASGEDLNVVNLLQAQCGHLFTDTQEFTGRPSVAPDGKTIVYASQENRQHLLGHLLLLGLKQPVMPWSSDGPSEAELGGNLETTTSRWADACHAQGGTVVLPHL
ncbi:MAG TPA: hypothetical protein VGP93_19250, partial [Polyangiaceae bacterium]|nr:hypothetical protein [Polyangiaceae bacterium]